MATMISIKLYCVIEIQAMEKKLHIVFGKLFVIKRTNLVNKNMIHYHFFKLQLDIYGSLNVNSSLNYKISLDLNLHNISANNRGTFWQCDILVEDWAAYVLFLLEICLFLILSLHN